MALIYRLEDAKRSTSEHYGGREYLSHIGLGAYRAGFAGSACGGDSHTDRHPNPYSDMKLYPIWMRLVNTQDYVFGFESIEQLRRWFSDREWMQGEGLEVARIAVYQVPQDKFKRGSFQVIGYAPEMKLVEVLPTDYLL